MGSHQTLLRTRWWQRDIYPDRPLARCRKTQFAADLKGRDFQSRRKSSINQQRLQPPDRRLSATTNSLSNWWRTCRTAQHNSGAQSINVGFCTSEILRHLEHNVIIFLIAFD